MWLPAVDCWAVWSGVLTMASMMSDSLACLTALWII